MLKNVASGDDKHAMHIKRVCNIFMPRNMFVLETHPIVIAHIDVASNSYIGIVNECEWYALTTLNVNGCCEPQHCICFKNIRKVHVDSHISHCYEL